jgi:glycosyltransferase involved in cell wall biosynthesis
MTTLSIIVPTHNRAECAVQTIKTLLALPVDVQIVVCDSSQVDDITHHFSGLYNESRLKLVRSEITASVVDNFNLGLHSADGDYLVFIGDDDFVTNEILDVAKWASLNEVDCLKFNFAALYYWHDFKHVSRGDAYSGTLHVSPFSGVVKNHNIAKSVSYALDNFGGGVFDMPRAYAGMISSTLAHKIVKKYGFLFGGVSPDIYSSFLISNEAKNCKWIDYPVIVPGASGLSTTGQSNSGGHYGKLRDNPHISPFKNLIWDDKIPEFYAVPTVWSYSLLKALEVVKRVEGVDFAPNFSRLIVKCFIYYPKSYRENLQTVKCLYQTFGKVKFSMQIGFSIGSEFLWGVSRIVNRVKARYIKKNVDVLHGLDTSLEASKAFEFYLHNKGVKLNLP